jgi:7-cyano-7-deazaguanine reductase
MTQENFKYLGKRSTRPSKELDSFPTPEHVDYIKFDSDEITSLCPVTQQPDFSKLVLEYKPHELCVESKSLKLYLWTFREEELFGEALANTIVDDVFEAIKPEWCKATIIQNIRGGLQLSVSAVKHKPA